MTAARIATAHLYQPLHDELLALLRSLESSGWSKPTVCGGWTVQDIAAHILDTQVRILSMGRDGLQPAPPDPPIESYGGLVGFLNRLNADWIRATRRMSPQVLIDLLAVTGPQLSAYVTSLDPDAPALFPVAWAGEDRSANWFDIGRNYTEYWHHQQQIRDAVGKPGLTGRVWLHPVIALFLRALPRAYAGVVAAQGVQIRIEVTGEAGGVWVLTRGLGGWELADGLEDRPEASVRLDDDTAWRFLTKGLSVDEARPRIRFEGDPMLAEPFLGALAVMA